uniref:Uncharacterized protein n=1 Tax=Clastoptera arizonana TaxID=38151 RepID=A0A1B6DXK6_9HEMI
MAKNQENNYFPETLYSPADNNKTIYLESKTSLESEQLPLEKDELKKKKIKILKESTSSDMRSMSSLESDGKLTDSEHIAIKFTYEGDITPYKINHTINIESSAAYKIHDVSYTSSVDSPLNEKMFGLVRNDEHFHQNSSDFNTASTSSENCGYNIVEKSEYNHVTSDSLGTSENTSNRPRVQIIRCSSFYDSYYDNSFDSSDLSEKISDINESGAAEKITEIVEDTVDHTLSMAKNDDISYKDIVTLKINDTVHESEVSYVNDLEALNPTISSCCIKPNYGLALETKIPIIVVNDIDDSEVDIRTSLDKPDNLEFNKLSLNDACNSSQCFEINHSDVLFDSEKIKEHNLNNDQELINVSYTEDMRNKKEESVENHNEGMYACINISSTSNSSIETEEQVGTEKLNGRFGIEEHQAYTNFAYPLNSFDNLNTSVHNISLDQNQAREENNNPNKLNQCVNLLEAEIFQHNRIFNGNEKQEKNDLQDLVNDARQKWDDFLSIKNNSFAEASKLDLFENKNFHYDCILVENQDNKDLENDSEVNKKMTDYLPINSDFFAETEKQTEYCLKTLPKTMFTSYKSQIENNTENECDIVESFENKGPVSQLSNSETLLDTPSINLVSPNNRESDEILNTPANNKIYSELIASNNCSNVGISKLVASSNSSNDEISELNSFETCQSKINDSYDPNEYSQCSKEEYITASESLNPSFNAHGQESQNYMHLEKYSESTKSSVSNSLTSEHLQSTLSINKEGNFKRLSQGSKQSSSYISALESQESSFKSAAVTNNDQLTNNEIYQPTRFNSINDYLYNWCFLEPNLSHVDSKYTCLKNLHQFNKYRDPQNMDETLIPNAEYKEEFKSPMDVTIPDSVLTAEAKHQFKRPGVKPKPLLRSPKFNPNKFCSGSVKSSSKTINPINTKLSSPSSEKFLLPSPGVTKSKIPVSKRPVLSTPKSEAGSAQSQKRIGYNYIKSPIRAYMQTASPVLIKRVKGTTNEFNGSPKKKTIVKSVIDNVVETERDENSFQSPHVVQRLKYDDAEAENIDPNYHRPSLQPVVYKSASNVFMKDNQDIQKKLPKLNDKFKQLLNVPKPNIYKHEGRVTIPPPEPGKLVTTPRSKHKNSSSTDISPQSEADISICVKKTLLKTNTLTRKNH